MSTTIESLELEISSNSTKAVSGIDALTQSLTKLKQATSGASGLKSVSQEVKNLGNSFKQASSKMREFTQSLKQASKANKDGGSSFTDFYHKMKVGINTIKRVGSAIYSAVEKSMDYTENMNLFSVSMGEYANEAYAYAEKVSDAMGIDTSEWIRAQGVFMTLATGFGVAGDRANTMSKNLTQLGYDLASFYNLSTDDAMQKLQSGLSGELEPLRRLGYDLSQAKLEATALELGIDKSVSAMTQAEKAQLRYYAIMTQVTQTHGDMARTLEDPANQMRVFKAQCSMAAREIGNVFIPALNAILPYAIAVAKIIGMLAKSIAGLFGYEDTGVKESVDSVVNGTDSVTENLQDAQDEAKKLKSYLMGIDELNVINPNTDSETEDLSGTLDFALPEYDFMAGLIESKVNTIVEEMKEWLGITDDIDTWAELFDTRLGDILETVGLIGAGIALWKVTTTFSSMITALTALLANPVYAIAISVFLTIAGIIIAKNGIEDAIKNGLDGFNFGEILAGSLLTAGGAAIFGSKLAVWINKVFTGSAVDMAITKFGIKIGASTYAGAGAALAAGVAVIIAGIGLMFVGIYDAIKEKLDWLNGTVTALGATLIGAGIGFLIGGPIGALIGAAIGLVVGLITDLVIWIVQNWEEVSAWLKGVGEWFKGLWQSVCDWFKGLWESISGFFVGLWEGIKGVWNTVAKWFDTKVIKPIINFFAPIVEIISQFFEGCWLIIRAVWLVVSTWFDENVIQPVVGFFKGLWESVSGFFTQLWADICLVWGTVSTWFNNTVVTPVVGFFKGVWTSVSSFFVALWEDIKAVWAVVSTWFEDTIITPVKTAFETACAAIGEFFSKLWLGIRQGVASAMNAVIGGIESALNWVIGGINKFLSGFDTIVQWAADVLGEDWGGMTLVKEVKFDRIPVPTFATGGFPEQGQMFIAREAGAEMVGNIGRRTAVANNDQIVSGIAGGVAEANEEQNTLLREQNSLLRAILEKDSGVYLDGKNLANSVEKYQRERGRVLITGGVV